MSVTTLLEPTVYKVQLHAALPVQKADVLALFPPNGLQSFAPSTKQPVLVQHCDTDNWPSNEPQPTFDADLYFDNLSANITGSTLLMAARLHSTQSLLQDNRDVLMDGTVCVADMQTMGKGRGGNEWTSPEGCLMFSCTRALQVSGTRLPFVQYAVCMAVVEAVQELYAAARKKYCMPALKDNTPPLLRVKWPNDIYYIPPAAAAQQPSFSTAPPTDGITDTAQTLPACSSAAGTKGPTSNGDLGGSTLQGSAPSEVVPFREGPGTMSGALKVGGILCHTAYKEQRFYVTMGVGLNVTNREPTACVQDVLRLALEQECACSNDKRQGLQQEALVTREELLGRILSQTERHLDTIIQDGFSTLQPQYLQYWLHTGQKVTLDETLTDGQPVSLTVIGLTDSGYLMAADEAGTQYELHPDGNSFDFFQGLIRKKLP